MKNKELVEELKRFMFAKDNEPPCLLYSELVKATGKRNSWTVNEWLIFLNSLKGIK